MQTYLCLKEYKEKGYDVTMKTNKTKKVERGREKEGRGFQSFICDEIYDSSVNIFFFF